MVLNLDMLDFIRECLEDRVNVCKINKENCKEWYMRYDDKYNMKYSFYVGYSSIISQYTLFEYGRIVVTISGDLIDGIIKGLNNVK